MWNDFVSYEGNFTFTGVITPPQLFLNDCSDAFRRFSELLCWTSGTFLGFSGVTLLLTDNDNSCDLLLIDNDNSSDLCEWESWTLEVFSSESEPKAKNIYVDSVGK